MLRFINKKINIFKNLEFIEKKIFLEENSLKFGNLIDDLNPIHFDNNYASKTIFKNKIVHGIFVGSMYSSIISKNLPGSIYLKQNLNFKNPVFYGEEIISVVKIKEEQKLKNKKIIDLDTYSYKFINDKKQIVIEGEALIKISKEINYI